MLKTETEKIGLIRFAVHSVHTNHRLQDRQVNWEIKQPFNLVAELTGNFPPNNHAGPNKNYPLTGKNLESCIWSDLNAAARTYFEHNPS